MSFPRYPAYKDSGVEWLGEVPAHWEVAPFKHLVDIQNGADHKNIERDDGYPVIGSGGVFAYASEFMYDGESVLLGRKGTIDKPLFVSGRFWTVDTMYWTKIAPEASARFAYYTALTIPFDYYSTNTALPSMTKGVLHAHRVARPSLSEQCAIASFLDRETAKIDALVEEQKRLIELLKEKRRAVISQAVTKGLDPNVPMKDSGVEWLGEVPAHWEITRLKFVATVQTGIAKGKDNAGKETVTVPYLRVANVQDGRIDLTDVAEIEISAVDLPRYLLRRGDVLMNEGGDFDKLGRGHVWDASIDPCIHQNHVFAVRPAAVSPEWLNLFAGTTQAQFYFMSRSKQSTNLASISSTNVMELPVAVPTSDESARIAGFVADLTGKVDALIDEAARGVRLLTERRAALISAAVTGKINVCSLTA
ncbi:MAG: restriction endonuclease subunit S [Lysobacterales bacterium]